MRKCIKCAEEGGRFMHEPNSEYGFDSTLPGQISLKLSLAILPVDSALLTEK